MNLNAFENTVVGTLEECDAAWDNAVGKLKKRRWKTYGGDTVPEWSVFVGYDSLDDVDEKVKYPDFQGNPLICEGELYVVIGDWDKKDIVLTNPRINDVFRFFANNHDGHHGYFEGIVYNDKNNTLTILSGS